MDEKRKDIKKRIYPAQIDEEELRTLASFHVANIDLAVWFKCSPALLSTEPWCSIIAEAKSATRFSLKKRLLQKALHEDDTKSLLFALKNYCSMEENPNHSQKDTVEDGSSNDNFEGFSINGGK